MPDKRLDQIVGQLMSVLLIAIPAGLLLTYGLAVYLPATHKAYAIDTKVDVPAEIYRDAPFTVVLFARSSCGVCERSKEIFSVALNRAREQQHVNVTLVVPTTLSDGDRSYGRDLGIDPERVVHLPSSALLHVVPTILVVDRTGTIRFARSGVPPLLSGPQLANEVLAAMQGS